MSEEYLQADVKIRTTSQILLEVSEIADLQDAVDKLTVAIVALELLGLDFTDLGDLVEGARINAYWIKEKLEEFGEAD